MHFVGIDLAWGPVKQSGIAVVDNEGGLQYVGAAVTDDDIAAAVTPFIEGSCVVAIDAPLKVTNPDKMRPAETAITKVFGPFDAGAFPANTKLFPSPRGTRLAEILELDIDPHSLNPRRAIEVFPHPATIALFRLGRTFKYKERPGRTLKYRQSELLRLMNAVEGLASASVPLHVKVCAGWNSLRRNVEQAKNKADLGRAEDPIDAVMCAYIALYAHHRRTDVTVFGDFPANGYILTPTLPLGLEPEPRQRVPTTSPNPATNSLSPEVAERSVQCDSLLSAVRRSWADICQRVHELGSDPTNELTDILIESLTRAEDALELTYQELGVILAHLASPSTSDAGVWADDSP